MGKVLILKTSTDETVQKLIAELKKNGVNEIECLVQSSQYRKYQTDYPDIDFIDICGERFENLSLDIIESISSKWYSSLYITLTGERAYNFWNVIEIVYKVHFRRGFFYNCNGKKRRFSEKDILKDAMCRFYIRWSDFFY